MGPLGAERAPLAFYFYRWAKPGSGKITLALTFSQSNTGGGAGLFRSRLLSRLSPRELYGETQTQY